MVVAIVGLPGGLEPRHESLQQLVKKGTIAFYEVVDREVIFYWRGMAASSANSLSFDVSAAIPGQFEVISSLALFWFCSDSLYFVSRRARRRALTCTMATSTKCGCRHSKRQSTCSALEVC